MEQNIKIRTEPALEKIYITFQGMTHRDHGLGPNHHNKYIIQYVDRSCGCIVCIYLFLPSCLYLSLFSHSIPIRRGGGCVRKLGVILLVCQVCPHQSLFIPVTLIYSHTQQNSYFVINHLSVYTLKGTVSRDISISDFTQYTYLPKLGRNLTMIKEV